MSSASESKSVEAKCPFVIGDLMVCEHPRCAGASTYPVFGKISSITPTGKFRISLLEKLRPPCEANSSGVWGSNTLIEPEQRIVNKTGVLTIWTSDTPNVLYVKGKSQSGYDWWTKYNSSQKYWDQFDNGD
jgi:hypothetical protein